MKSVTIDNKLKKKNLLIQGNCVFVSVKSQSLTSRLTKLLINISYIYDSTEQIIDCFVSRCKALYYILGISNILP